jgi:hypothetical protein
MGDSYCRRALPRWHTRFGEAIGDLGVPKIVAALAPDPALRVTPTAVYEWLQGHTPRPERARALVELSGGRLTLDMIYSHNRELAVLRGEAGRADCERKAQEDP